MTPRELERLEKDSIYSLRMNNDLKDLIINSRLNELNRVVKKEINKRELVVLVIEI